MYSVRPSSCWAMVCTHLLILIYFVCCMAVKKLQRKLFVSHSAEVTHYSKAFRRVRVAGAGPLYENKILICILPNPW